MFDSKMTDYKISSSKSPYGHDIAADLAAACHEKGLRLGFYYSPVDWYHPDYRSEQHENYIKFMHGQVRELCSQYGSLDILWFDGLQIHPMEGSGGEEYYDPNWAKDWDTHSLFKMIRRRQPHIIINNRCGLEGDFDTPEQHVGFYQTDRPWESCITLCNQWAWKPDDTMKSVEECVRTLVRCAGGDGNLLLNVGPMPTGEIEPRQAERLKEIGSWLEMNGKSIYNTRGGPVPPMSWGVTTQHKNTVFVHVLAESDKVIAIPKFKAKLRSVSLIDGTQIDYESTKIGTLVKLPERKDPIDTIVVLSFDRRPQ